MNTLCNIQTEQSVRIASLGRKRMPTSVAFRTECILRDDDLSTERRIPDGMPTTFGIKY
ncbi:MAG: hypothetical protein LBE91_09210 [Tannerella sp.]|nr:hypothetical protein [Tannerella sp.]